MCLVFAGQPFDLVKVRLQTAAAGVGSSTGPAVGAKGAGRQNAVSIARQVLATEGLKGFYRGMSAPLAGVTPIFALCFWAYESAKTGLAGLRGIPGADTTKLSLSDVAIAGALSAVPTTLIMAPGERIKVLLQVQSAGGSSKFSGPGDVVKTLYRTGGLRSIFAGSAATLLRDGTGSMAYFSVYEGLKRRATAPVVRAETGPMDGTLSPAPLPEGTAAKQQLSASTVLVAGGLAGMANWLVALPIDTIKSRIQAQAPATDAHWRPPSVLSMGRTILAQEGLKGLYRGVGPALLRAFPANAACFGGMEASKAFLDKFM